MSDSFEYDVFISYSRADKAIADELYARLTQYRVPKELLNKASNGQGVSSSHLTVFMDRKGLEASYGLTAALESKLRKSKWLVIICSKAALRSEGVQGEVAFFLNERARENIIPVLHRQTNETRSAELWPLALRDKAPLPVAPDILNDGGIIPVSHKILGAVMGVSQNEIAQEQAALDRRRQQTAIGAASLVVLLVAVAGILGFYAYNQRMEALQESNDAAMARSMSLTKEASALNDQGWHEEAMLKLLEADPLGEFRPIKGTINEVARDELIRALNNNRLVSSFNSPFNRVVSVLPDSLVGNVVVVHADGTVRDASVLGKFSSAYHISDLEPHFVQFAQNEDKVVIASPDGHIEVIPPRSSLIALAEEKGEVLSARVPLERQAPDKKLSPPTHRLTALDINPNEQTFLTGDTLGILRLWDMSSAEQLNAINVTKTDAPTPLDEIDLLRFSVDGFFSPDGSRILTWSNGFFQLWSAVDGSHILDLQYEPTWRSTKPLFSPDGKNVAVGVSKGSLVIWDTKNGDVVAEIRIPVGDQTKIAARPDWSQFLCLCRDALYSIDITSKRKEKIAEWTTEQPVDIEYSPNGKTFSLAFSDGTIAFWSTASRTPILEFAAHNAPVTDIEYDISGKLLVSGARDGAVRFWYATLGEKPLTAINDIFSWWDTALHFDGYLWNGSYTAEQITRTNPLLEWHSVHAKSQGDLEVVYGYHPILPSTRRIVGDRNGYLEIWQGGERLLRWRAHQGRIQNIKFSRKLDKIASSAKDEPLTVWDAETGQQTIKIFSCDAQADNLDFGHDSELLACGADSGLISVYSLSEDQLETSFGAQLGATNIVRFDPHGKLIATHGRGMRSVKVWEASTGTPAYELKGHNDVVSDFIWSNDGLLLMTAATDKTARIWNARTGAEVAVFDGLSSEVSSIALSEDKRLALTAEANGKLKIWSVSTGTQLAVINMTEGQVARFQNSVNRSGEPFRFQIGGASFKKLTSDEVITVLGDKTAYVWKLPERIFEKNSVLLIFEACAQIYDSGTYAFDEEPNETTRSSAQQVKLPEVCKGKENTSVSLGRLSDFLSVDTAVDNLYRENSHAD